MIILYFTALAMSSEKIAIIAIFIVPVKKQEKLTTSAAAAKEINDVEGSGTINVYVTKNWFRHFKIGDTSLEHKPRSGSPSVVVDESLLEMVEHKPSTSTCTLSIECGPSQSTINQQHHRLVLVNKHYQEDSHELTNDQVQ